MPDNRNDLFRPGFRLSVLDVTVLIAGIAGAFWAARIDEAFGWAVVFTVGHFFLFCNVLRMARSRELVWTSVYLTLALCTLNLGTPAWPITWAASGIVTAAVTVIEIRAPSYHGVFWKSINPGLEAWWNDRRTELS